MPRVPYTTLSSGELSAGRFFDPIMTGIILSIGFPNWSPKLGQIALLGHWYLTIFIRCGHSAVINKTAQPWQNNETPEQKYYLNIIGYDYYRAVVRVAQVLDMDPAEVTAYGKSPHPVKARALLCFWAHRKLGMTTVEIPKNLNICQSAVSRLSKRGEKFAIERGHDLIGNESIKT